MSSPHRLRRSGPASVRSSNCKEQHRKLTGSDVEGVEEGKHGPYGHKVVPLMEYRHLGGCAQGGRKRPLLLVCTLDLLEEEEAKLSTLVGLRWTRRRYEERRWEREGMRQGCHRETRNFAPRLQLPPVLRVQCIALRQRRKNRVKNGDRKGRCARS